MSENANTCVQFRGAGKYLGDSWVVREVNAELPTGETTAILGESGSGKTTLLRLINAMYEPDEGCVEVFGEVAPASNLHEFRRKIGYAVQGAALFPHMTIAENITCIAALEAWQAEQMSDRLDELFTLTGLSTELRDRFPHELSGGQQHRVGLCRALMLEPRLLLLDEPFSAIDAIARQDIHAEFSELQAKLQFSAVLVTHDFAEAKRLATYLLVLVNGQVVQQGATADVLTNPKPAFLKALIATSS